MRQQRVGVVFLALLVGYGLLALHLVRLQVVEHDMWERESLRSTMRYRSLPFERGWILDRHGEPLARTEEVSDLVFVYRDWRRDSVAGALSAAERLRHGEELSVSEALRFGDELLADFEQQTLGDIAALEPRGRRADLLYYVRVLFGEDLEQAALDGLRAGGDAHARRLRELPGYAAARERLVQRRDMEQAALPDLARVLQLPLDELVAGMEVARARAQSDVQSALADAAKSREPRSFADTREGYAVFDAARRQYDERPRRLAAAVPHDTQTLVKLRTRAFPGFHLNPQQRRVYPSFHGREVAPLLLGDVGAPPETMFLDDTKRDPLKIAEQNAARLVDLASLVDPTEAELREMEELRLAVRELDYRADEETGRRGLERVLEPVLRGKRGWIASHRDSEGRTEERRAPQRGLNVTLTLDLALQAAAEEVLDEVYAHPPRDDSARNHWTGAVVVLDARTGEVLALASGPRTGREQFARDYVELQDHPDAPLLHRALRPNASGNLPPPGSVFKPVTALAWRGFARATGEPDLDPEHWCGKTLVVGSQPMSCLGSHGNIGLRTALERSCNIYFYELGLQMGSAPLYAMAARFGFGQRTPLVIDNPRLLAAGVPLDRGAQLEGVLEEFTEIKGQHKGGAAAMRFAIGQAPLDDVTPLQVAVMMGALGTGQLRTPSLVRHVEGYPELPPATPRDLQLHPGDLDAIHAGLRAVVESPHGTAHELTELYEASPYDALRGRLAVKTGTAEVGGDVPDHAWLAGFFPVEAPRVAFAVLIEEVGLHGGEGAVPVFSAFLKKPAVREWLATDVLGGAPAPLR